MSLCKKVISRKFPAELRNIIDEVFEGNMAEYSRRSGVASGTMGHYLASNRYPSPDRLAALLRPLSGSNQNRLLEAFLMDQVPPEFRSWIKVQTGPKPAIQPAKLTEDLGISGKTLRALEHVGKRAAEDPNTRELVEQMAKVFGWNPGGHHDS